MPLSSLLMNRLAINVLFYVQEQEQQGSYTTTLQQAEQRFQQPITLSQLHVLVSHNLLTTDEADGIHLTITKKGKQFLTALQQVKASLETKPVQPKIALEYSLTNLEKQLLLFIFRLGKEHSDGFVSLQQLTQDLYPHEESALRSSQVAKQVKKLEELNLTTKEKRERKNYYSLTAKGKEVLEKEYVKELLS